jgi:CRP-like cAMP-binding protein/predicted MFS family arabinose efflux permease
VASTSRARYRDALRHRDFRLLTGAFVVNQVGGWAYSVVLAVYLFDRTGSTTVLALSAASRWVPAMLVAGYASVLADRYERTLVMRVSGLAASAAMVVLTVAVAVDAPVPLLIFLSALGAVLLSPYNPAAGALTPDVVGEKDLAAANGLFSALENLVVVLGPLLGGAILLVASPEVGVGLNAVSFLLSVLILQLLSVRATGSAGQEGGNAFTQWLVGVRTLGRHRTALVLVLFAALDSAVYGASTVVYVPLSIELGTGSEGYSYLIAAAALGGVLGASLANRLAGASRVAPVIVISILVQTTPYLLTVLVDRPASAFVLQLVSGVGMIVVDVLAITALQRDLPRDVLGRVLGVFDALVMGAIVLSSFLAATLLSLTSLTTTLIAIGTVIPGIALVCLPVLLRMDRETAAVADRLRPRVELLSVLDLLSGVDRTTLERLAAHADERPVPAGAVLIQQGDDADALWVLVSGSLTVQALGEDGAVRQLPALQAPSYVGELGLLHKVPRTATVSAGEDSTLLRLEGSDFLDALAGARASASLLSIAGTRLARTTPPSPRDATEDPVPR